MKYVGYYRVSTQKQGQSGLGLESQQAAVNAAFDIVASFTEVETGTNKRDRPELTKAINQCRRIGATLVIAKLDRLARNVAFVANLMESGIDFVACDNPNATRLTMHIMAAVAEDEAHRISERTKAALAAYKARGGTLGATNQACQNLTDEARRKGAEAMRAKAEQAYKHILPMMLTMRDNSTLQQIADHLNEQGELTTRGKSWTSVAVMRVLDRAGDATH